MFDKLLHPRIIATPAQHRNLLCWWYEPCCPKESHSQKTGLASDLLRSVHQQCPVWPICYLHSSVNMLRVTSGVLRVEFHWRAVSLESCRLHALAAERRQCFVRPSIGGLCDLGSVCKASIKPSISIWMRFAHFEIWKWKRSVWNIETQSEHQIETFELKCASISNVLLMSATFVSSNSSAPWCWGTASHHPGGQTDKPYMFETRHTTKFQNIWSIWSEMECPWNTCSHLLNCPQIAHSWPCAPGCRKAPRLSTALPPPCRIGSRPCKRAPQAILPVARRKSFSNGVQLCTMYSESVSKTEHTFRISWSRKHRDFVGTQELNETHGNSCL